MKQIIFLIAIVPFFALVPSQSQADRPPHELNKEVVNYPGKNITPEEKSKIPQSILVKKDENGKLYVLESKVLLDQVNEMDAKELDKLAFVPLEGSDKIKMEDVVPSLAKIDELDRDTPRQSWYVYWGWGYNRYPYYYPYYYMPIYYYSYYTYYNYYPYYAYNYSGCNYYWYRAW